MEIKQIEIKTPPAKIKIIIGSFNELNDFCDKENISQLSTACLSRSVWFMKRNRFSLLVRNDASSDIATLVHECIHLKNFIMESRDWKLQFDNDEPEAYLLEEMFRKIYNHTNQLF